MATVEIDAVHHAYDDGAAVLGGIDLEVANGEAHALLGGSGAGKTTLLNLLSGLLTPSTGRILFDGLDVTRLPPGRRRVAQVFQFPVVYDGMTVRDNLAFPLRNGRYPDVDDRVSEISELLGLDSILNERSRTLSMFERQTVCLGRALVRDDVRLLLLDEPLTAVESAARWRLRRVLKDVQAALGLTTIYVTHDQLEALTFADRVSVMHQGRLVQTGTPQQLVEEPAHEYVGYFVGSPGMNLIPAGLAATPPPGADRLGFRPEWATVRRSRGPGIAAEVRRLQPLMADAGALHGLLVLRVGDVDVYVRQAFAGIEPGDVVRIDLHRCCWFAGGVLMGP